MPGINTAGDARGVTKGIVMTRIAADGVANGSTTVCD